MAYSIQEKKPLVTILTPVYNGVEFLGECVKSVIEQTEPRWEIIIGINGHGPDGGAAAETARGYAALDGRIRVHIQPEVHTKVDSLNDMMTHARADWICLLDCDDVWLPTKLARQLEVLGGAARNAAVIGTACSYFGEMCGSPSIRTGRLDVTDLLAGNQVINSSAMLHRSYAHWRTGFGMEDYDLWLRIAAAGSILYNIPENLVRHRIHGSSAFNSKGHRPELLQKYFAQIVSLNDMIQRAM
jgi:glycosyltransferase involved in cell wall biosynthesis